MTNKNTTKEARKTRKSFTEWQSWMLPDLSVQMKIRHIKYIKQKNIISERRPALYGKKHYPVLRCDETNHS